MRGEDTIGQRQAGLLESAAGGGGMVMIHHTENAKICAMKRLVRRGFLTKMKFGTPGLGKTLVYVITDDGRAALHKHRKEQT